MNDNRKHLTSREVENLIAATTREPVMKRVTAACSCSYSAMVARVRSLGYVFVTG